VKFAFTFYLHLL